MLAARSTVFACRRSMLPIGCALFPVSRHPSPVSLKRNFLFLTAMTLLTVAGCRRDAVFKDMSDSTFVRTMIELRKLPVSPADPALRAQRRDSILNSMGVTAAQVESTAVRLANDPALAAQIWRAIEVPGSPSPP